jgi:hypothetical protein
VAKRDLLKLPDDFERNLRALLATPPAPRHGRQPQDRTETTDNTGEETTKAQALREASADRDVRI